MHTIIGWAAIGFLGLLILSLTVASSAIVGKWYDNETDEYFNNLE